MIYFTGSRSRTREASGLQEVEKIELWKVFSTEAPEERKRDLAALIERMCELPSYAVARDVARDFGKGGLFARVGFTANLTRMVELGMLINPISTVFGLSPKMLVELGLLDRFLGGSSDCTAEQIWDWVRDEIRKLESTQSQMKQMGIDVWKR